MLLSLQVSSNNVRDTSSLIYGYTAWIKRTLRHGALFVPYQIVVLLFILAQAARRRQRNNSVPAVHEGSKFQ